MPPISKKLFRRKERELLKMLEQAGPARTALRLHPTEAASAEGRRLSAVLTEIDELVASYRIVAMRLRQPQHPTIAAWKIHYTGEPHD